MAHIINLIVQDGLKEIGDSIKRVRQAMRYIRQSPTRIKKFKDSCEMANITCKKILCLDVSTRWNSTYLMHAFERYKLVDHGLVNYLIIHVCEDGNCGGSLVSDDWNNGRNLVKFLDTFYELTLKISDSLYVTFNVHFSEISKLSCMLTGLVASEDIELQPTAVRMKEKFDKYWGEPKKIIFIACVLDPRNKIGFVEFAFEEMFGKEKVGEIEKDVIKFPILAEMARDVLAISISSIASECAFSTRGRILDSFRSSLIPRLVQGLICVQDWLRSETFPINIEEDLDYLEQIENGLIMPRLQGPKVRSPVWNHYEKFEETDDGWCKLRCIHCGCVFRNHARGCGTKSLIKHVSCCLNRIEPIRIE
ncbi:zinc finger BED domain-containing protein RICESLEEPER 3-like [Nicotiana tabacum]|uniref:zinc finger BED domain-containing protein RICESLEEPER 3-like n=1 Tax=Nicotiana tabacum TaxID=4097 RepID=UPI003F4E5989